MADRRDRIPIPAVRPAIEYAVQAILRHFGTGRTDPLRVLEAGCGVRSYSKRYLAPRWKAPMTVHGIDVDEYVRENQEVDQAFLGSVESMPFDNGTYDLVMAHYLLEHVADHRRTLGEMARVLRPGGLLVLTFPNPSAPEAVMTRATPLGFHRAFKWIVQGTKDVEKHVFPTVFSFRTVRNVETTLRENGCGAVRTGYLSETYYRFRRWLVPGYLALVYSRALDLLHVRFLKSSVVICACKDRS